MANAPLTPPVTAANPSAVPMSARAQELQEQILELQLKQLTKQTAETEEKERIELEGRKQGAMAYQKKRNEELQRQEACPHLKPNMQSALAGQRTHSQTLAVVCQFCSAEFTEKNVPRHLIPNSDVIGGPQIGSAF